jgi:outer membrane protein OmpA-like peptidoglycan-associated protein
MYFLETQDGITGQMYSDTFSIDKDPEAFPKQFKTSVIAELGDKDLQVFNDNTLIFASKREGGFGGYDLYVSEKLNGQWENPINLGPEINSKFDEIDPFVTKSGTKIFFSSNRIESLGGFDIYEANYNMEKKKWEIPTNLGIPINSAMDDCSFAVSADGMTAILSSDRPGSEGGSDIYMVYLKNQITQQLMYTEELPFLIKEMETAIVEEVIEASTQEIIPIEDKSIIAKEFIKKPLYYNEDEIIITPANKRILDRVKDLMVIYPELHITFSGHSTPKGMKEFELYFSIKRSEKAAEYLIKNGIESARITVKGLGANFPHTLKSENQSNSLAEKNNKRIDIDFTNIPQRRLKIINDNPSVSVSLKDLSFDIYSKTIKGLAYKIQVAKTKQMYKADIIRLYNSGIIEKGMDDDDYTYTIGVFDSYQQARSLKSELIRKGILEATVVPYIDDQAINNEQVLILKETFSDLNEYLKFETE